MNDANAEIKRLADLILKSPDVMTRTEALLNIRRYDSPRVIELLQHVSQKDRDKSVRDLADNLLTKKKLEAFSDSPQPTPVSSVKSKNSDNAASWVCRFCGAENTSKTVCTSCGGDNARTPAAAVNPKNYFLLQPANANFLSGKSRSISQELGMGCGLLFMVPFMLVGIFVLGMAFNDFQHYNTLSERGAVGQGEVTDKHISEGDDSDSYYIAYRFSHETTAYTAEDDVDKRFYENVEQGQTVEVLYDPRNPTLSALQGYNENPSGILIFGIVWNAIVFPAGFLVVWQSMRSKQLARRGTVINGQLITIKGAKDSDDDYILSIEYSFHAPDTQKLHIERAKGKRNDLKEAKLPQPGTPVAVIYQNPGNFRML